MRPKKMRYLDRAVEVRATDFTNKAEKLMLWYRLSSVFTASHRHPQAQIGGVAIPASVCQSEEPKLHGA